jgi:hypothetical protein
LYYEEGNDYDYREIGSYSYLSEILGMEIIVNSNIAFSLEKLTAGLLWEITYYGTTKEIVQEHLEEMFK